MTKLIQLKDAATHLHVSERTVHRYVSAGRLMAVKIGNRLQFVESDIDDFIRIL